jgi:hypothetical protein
MKKIIFSLAIMCQFTAFGQGAMDRTLKDACDCVNAYTKEVSDYDSYMNLIIECASPLIVQNADELSKELGISGKSQMEAIEEIGSQVGERLVVECPRFTEITFKVLGEDPTLMEEVMDEYSEEGDENGLIESGSVVSITKEIPCQIKVKNDMGETLNFLWTDPIGIEDTYISHPEKLKGKNVELVYYMTEIYDPKSGSYQTRKVLAEVRVK